MRIAVASCSIALVVGCLFGCSSDSNGAQGSGSVSCRQKADADNNSDCTGFAGKPRKLDCDLDSQTNEAVAAGRPSAGTLRHRSAARSPATP